MMYFNYFVVAAWAFAFGWFFGAIHVQNRNYEQNHQPEPAHLLSAEIPEPAASIEIPADAVSSSAAAD